MMFGMTFAEILLLLPAIIGALSVIAKYTKNKSDDKWIQMLWDLLNLFGQNTGKAANSEREVPTLKQIIKNAVTKAVDG